VTFSCRGELPPARFSTPLRLGIGTEPRRSSPLEPEVLILGLVLVLIGWLTGISIVTTIGIVLLVVGAVLMVLGSVNRPVLGRRYWY
jgi:hypothetical protein